MPMGKLSFYTVRYVTPKHCVGNMNSFGVKPCGNYTNHYDLTG